jgi:lipopolysaccharide/colanic/teichoic acid biosynthesis glycosyltransferase
MRSLTKFLLAVLTLGVLPMVQQELYGWCFSLAEWLLQRAARSFPKGIRERYEAEWLGDLDMLRGRNLYALYWAIRTVMHRSDLRRAVHSRAVFEQAATRAVDLTVATLALVLLAPLFATIALVIKLTSGGPVFHREERVGLRGRYFTALTYRTTVDVDADRVLDLLHQRSEIAEPLSERLFKLRSTSIGRFLRDNGLDSLPLFLNVLKGEMSLVGPKAPLPHEPNHHLEGRPGIVDRLPWKQRGSE